MDWHAALAALSGMLILFSIVPIASTELHDAANLLFPACLAVVNGLIFFLVLFGQRRLTKTPPSA